MKYLAIVIALGIFSGCTKTCVEKQAEAPIPTCISAKIEFLKTQPKGNPAYSVYEYTYNGQKVYFFPAQCCDKYSELYDANCNLICHPSGGIGGGGDGTCQGFFNARTDEVLIWRDNR